jgi:AraC-like DNA-binding protein
VVGADQPDGALFGERLLPPPELEPFIHHFWWLVWDLRKPFTAEVLPHPAARILFEEGASRSRGEVEGVFTTRQSRTRVGQGELFGIQFRPVTFQALLGQSMSSVTDQVVPLARVLGAKGASWSKQVFAAKSIEAKLAVASTFLAARLGPLSVEVKALRDVVERLSSDRSLLRVEDVASELELDSRAVQRRFLRYVGVGPKWVIRRYRLIEAAERLKAPRPPALAALADALGYADQAHFARDFKKVVGHAPGEFTRNGLRR